MELIKITQNEQGEQLVSGRELHQFLEVKSRFNDWIKNRIEKYRFVENIDFTTLTKNLVNGGKETDYIIRLDMAKELSMVENNDKGRQARRYFIECEKQLKTIVYNTQYIKKLEDKTPMEQFKDNVVALNEAFNVLGLNIPKELIGSTAITTTQKATGYDFEEVKLLLNKQDEEQYHSASGLLGRLGVKRNRTNETLVLLGLQVKGTTTMQPYALTELGKEYGVERTYTNKGHQGYEIKWKEVLLDFVKDNFENIPKEFIK